MQRRIEQEEAITGLPEARKYAGEIKKLAGLLYRPFLTELNRFHTGSRYLEIGAGPGVLATMIAANNPDISITAVDISPDMVTVAGEYIRERKLQNRINYLQVDVNDKTAIRELGKFDLVYSTFSLHHWQDQEKSIANLWDSVAENGRLFILDFTRVRWLYYLPVNNGDINSIRAAYTVPELKAMVQKMGLQNFTVKTSFPFFLKLIITKSQAK